jgi:hypothetical protein
MGTARDLIKSSLKLIGVLASGENPSAEDQTDALLILNSMLDSWSTESLFIYSKTIEDFSFQASKQVYTMGSSLTADFNTSRPQKILHAAVIDQTVTPNNEIPIEIITFDQWASLRLKTTSSTYATKLYVDYQFPLVNLNFYPVPTNTNGLRLYSWKPVSQIATANSTISLPPGYDMALKYNLAVVLAPEYGKQLMPEVAEIAATSKANIMRMNSEPIYSRVDPSIQANQKAWDWRTGE